jgi:hypothetical protein
VRFEFSLESFVEFLTTVAGPRRLGEEVDQRALGVVIGAE